MRLIDFRETFQDELRDKEFAQAYLMAALEESQDAQDFGIFLTALRQVAQANRAVSQVAEAAGVTRQALYKGLSENGNPSFQTVLLTLRELGMGFQISTAQNTPSQQETAGTAG
jgi:probable addiction module antidote protein